MENATGSHWLEEAIGSERDPEKIATLIAQNPKFRDIVRNAVNFAKKAPPGSGKDTRYLAEHIVSLLYHSFPNFETSH
jgi:hypothetical protein